MPIAAVPEYLGQDFSDASPGMRFGMYLAIWTTRADQENEVEDFARRDSAPAQELRRIRQNEGMEAAIAHMQDRRNFPRLWEKNTHAAKQAWSRVAGLGVGDRKRMAALADRQLAMASAAGAGEQLFVLDAVSIAPFTTGLGNEHPLENGFAFLWPYGLPYLPGSGVKGALRQAARELVSGEWDIESDWTTDAIDALFGSEDSDNPRRGTLSFWDVVPQVKGDSLMVEVMTGHQSHYYMKGDSPHDSGQPNPVNFLTVPPGSGFTFQVFCDVPFLRRIAPDLAENDRWKALLRQAFEHAFDWIGFGAKTAVGYGAMTRDDATAERRVRRMEQQREAAERRSREEAERREHEARLAQLDPIEREVAEMPDIASAIRALEEGRWGDEQARAAAFIRRRMEREGAWVEQSNKKNPAKDKRYQRTLRVLKYLK